MGSVVGRIWSEHKKEPEKMNKFKNLRYLPIMVFQLVLMVLFFVFVRYGGEKHHDLRGFEGTHVMIFVGFGFLMTFLKKYSYSALGFNWFLAAVVIQWAFLCQNFYHLSEGKIYATKETLLGLVQLRAMINNSDKFTTKNFTEADVMAATVLITFGALLGLASDLQLLFISVIEVAVACANFYLVGDKFKAADVGGSIAIHAFGAYFGLGASFAMRPHHHKKTTDNPAPSTAPATVDLSGPTYTSDVTAMIGSLFLWIYWPSFNSALTSTNSEYQRAVINTYLSLASATVTTFVMSSLVSHHHGKLDMVHIQNSTLAGGVAVGSVCNMHITAGGAVAIGIGAGIMSVLGYRYLTPCMTKLGIRDTCGVHNLHGMPGVFSGLLSVVFAALATREVYGDDLGAVFGAMGGDGEEDTGIPAMKQALNQLYATLATIVIATVAGGLTGLFAKMPCLSPLVDKEHYNDDVNWELPD